MTRNKTLKIRRRANHRPFIALRVKRNKENSGNLRMRKNILFLAPVRGNLRKITFTIFRHMCGVYTTLT